MTPHRPSAAAFALAVALAAAPAGRASAQHDHGGSDPAPASTAADPIRPSPRRALAPETPQQLYEQGLRQMRRGYYDEAIVSFEKVRNHFPFNQYSVLAELRVADCLYEKAAYMEAVEAYRQFARLHPRHAEADYVAFRTARSEFQLAPVVPQRDQEHSVRALERLRRFENEHPQSQYAAEVGKLRARTELRLARRAYQIASFYWKQRQWAAAERRYRMTVEEFPASVLAPRARLRQATCLWRLGRLDEARAALGALAVAQPDNPSGKRALRFLEAHPEAPAP